MNNKAKQAMLRMEAYAKFPYLIEVELASGRIFRYANCTEDVVFNDDGEEKTFSAGWFNIKRPDIQESEIGDGTLTISAIDETWIKVIREEGERADLRFVATIIYDGNDEIETVEAIEDTHYKLTNADWNDMTISWNMIFDENREILIPCDIATSVKCSGVS